MSELCDVPSHWSQHETLDDWLKREGVPGIAGIDTRQLTKIIREKGTMLGQIFVGDVAIPDVIGEWDDPNQRNLVQEVSVQVISIYFFKTYSCINRGLLKKNKLKQN